MRAFFRIGFPSFVIILASAGLVSAQAICPTHALLSIARAGAACANLDAGKACYGSGSATSTAPEGVTVKGLIQPGDRVVLRDLASIRVAPAGSGDDAEVSLATLVIRTSTRASDLMSVLLIKDAELGSEVAPPLEVVAQATGTMHIRATPASDGTILADVGVPNSVVADGRTQTGDWLRVLVPASGDTGWVSAALVKTTENMRNLPIVDQGDEVAQPFEVAHLTNGVSSACGGTLPAGALLQTPSTDLATAVTITLNNLALRLAGTAFVSQRDNTLTLTMLDGIAELGEQYVPAGAESSATLDTDGNATGTIVAAAPYNAELTVALPINNLPRSFQITPPQTQSAIDTRIAMLTQPTPTPFPTATIPANVCRRTIGRDATIWSGPGEDFEVLSKFDAGTPITPVLAATDPLGAVWWQLNTSGWVARADVHESGDCSAQQVPVAGRLPAPPTNTYSLERCQSSNGPVRVGQQVTFEFIPPAWDNYGAALAATQTDPGHVMLNANRYRANASQPIRLGEKLDPLEDRYIRRFTLVWTAQPGTYRIIGDWLTYEPGCNLTVPVE